MTSLLFHNDTCSFNHLWYESHKNLITSLCIELGQVDTIPAMIQKFLGDKLKIKPLRDPNQPKRAITSYLYFCNDKRPALMKKMKAKSQKINVGVIQKELGELWRKMTDKEKKPYAALSEKDKERYREAMEVFKAGN
jgi:hypothetical protein